MCQAWEWKRHSVVTMARRLRRTASRASAGTAQGAARTPVATCLRNSRRGFIWAEKEVGLEEVSSLALDQLCAVIVGVMSALINGGSLGLEWFSTHLDVNFLDLGGEGIAYVARNRLLFQQGCFDVLQGRVHFVRFSARVLLNLFP